LKDDKMKTKIDIMHGEVFSLWWCKTYIRSHNYPAILCCTVIIGIRGQQQLSCHYLNNENDICKELQKNRLWTKAIYEKDVKIPFLR